MKSTTCELCGRQARTTFHHLIPRAVHTKKRFRRQFEREEMKHRGLVLCQLCHYAIHDLIPDEKQLAQHFNTRELLLADPRIAKHVNWARKQRN